MLSDNSQLETDDVAKSRGGPSKPAAFVVVRIHTNFLLSVRKDYRVGANLRNRWSR
jgi:hypothetical protein